MIEIAVPGRGRCQIENVVLDMNGTISIDGEVAAGVVERLKRLRAVTHLFMLTADTCGTAVVVAEELGLDAVVLEPGEGAAQKLEFMRRLDAERSVAIGNGVNDVRMLREAAVGVCVVGAEGAATAAVLAADVIVKDVRDALDLLLKPQRLVATLRT